MQGRNSGQFFYSDRNRSVTSLTPNPLVNITSFSSDLFPIVLIPSACLSFSFVILSLVLINTFGHARLRAVSVSLFCYRASICLWTSRDDVKWCIHCYIREHTLRTSL